MMVFGSHWLKVGIARKMRARATALPTYTGLATEANIWLLQQLTGQHLPTGTQLIFSRDSNMHTSGWWKNPDYERCWHLSISFVDPLTGEPAPKEAKLTDAWLEVFFDRDQRYIWAEPPYSEHGRARSVWHYRVFCDSVWSAILPRGEVYSREFTEKGWLSFSELRGAHARALGELQPQAGEQ